MNVKSLLLIAGAAYVGYNLLTKKKVNKELDPFDALAANMEYKPGQFADPEIHLFYEPDQNIIQPDVFV